MSMQKGGIDFMMDLIMIAVLAGCTGLVTLLVLWCQKQVDRNE